MKTIRLFLLALVLWALPTVASAESDWWDVIEGLSGPGPFHGITFGQRLFCVKENADSRGFGVATCMSDLDPDNKIRGLVNFEFGYYTSGSNQRFSDTPTDQRPVHLTRIHATYFYRVSPLLDVGAGGGVMILTGDGFDNQTKFTITPFSMVFTPLGFIRTKWGRFVRVNFSESYIAQDLKGSDFNSTSSYQKNGEFNRKFGIGVDIGSFFTK
jgi:hypothetical protein